MSTTIWQDDDTELGFIGAALKATAGAAKGVKKIAKVFKKKKQAKKKKSLAAKGKVLNLPDIDIQGDVAAAAKQKIRKAARGLDPNDVRAIVREVVGSVPSPVRQTVLEALRAFKDESAANAQARAALTEQVDDALKPDIAAMLAVLQAQQLQGAATHEHKELVAREEFRSGTRDGLKSILARLADMDARLNRIQSRVDRSAIVSPNRVPIWGPMNVLDG